MKQRVEIVGGQSFGQNLVNNSRVPISLGHQRREKRKLARLVAVSRPLVVFILSVIVIICTFILQSIPISLILLPI